MARFAQLVVATVALALGSLVDHGLAHPPPPPCPDCMTAIDAASCDSQSALTKPEPIPVRVSSMTPERIVEKRPGTVTWEWGYHFAFNDPRVGQVTSLAVDNKLGLIATTADHQWLILNFGSIGNLAAVKAMGLAPMRGAPGRPTAIAWLPFWHLVSFPGQSTVLRYSTDACGTGALGVPVFNTTGLESATIVVEAAYTTSLWWVNSGR